MSRRTGGVAVAETRMVRAPDGRSLAFCEWGDPDGAPLFFLHGSPGSRLLRSVNGEYERHAIRAVTYDRPGYGQSGRQRRHRVADAAGDVQAIADHLGLAGFAVVGVSAGGPYALAAAAELPGRVTRCATIVSVGPRTPAIWTSWRTCRRRRSRTFTPISRAWSPTMTCSRAGLRA